MLSHQNRERIPRHFDAPCSPEPGVPTVKSSHSSQPAVVQLVVTSNLGRAIRRFMGRHWGRPADCLGDGRKACRRGGFLPLQLPAAPLAPLLSQYRRNSNPGLEVLRGGDGGRGRRLPTLNLAGAGGKMEPRKPSGCRQFYSKPGRDPLLHSSHMAPTWLPHGLKTLFKPCGSHVGAMWELLCGPCCGGTPSRRAGFRSWIGLARPLRRLSPGLARAGQGVPQTALAAGAPLPFQHKLEGARVRRKPKNNASILPTAELRVNRAG